MKAAYVTYASKVAALFGADEATARAEMEDVLVFETELANVSTHWNICSCLPVSKNETLDTVSECHLLTVTLKKDLMFPSLKYLLMFTSFQNWNIRYNFRVSFINFYSKKGFNVSSELDISTPL